MSWSFSAGVKADEDPAVVLAEVRRETDPASSAAAYGAREATEESIDAAIQAASAVVLAVRGGLDVTVQLSGHSNPAHQPVDGWSNDTVNIHVSQVKASV